MQAATYGGTIEGFGIGAAGKINETYGSTKYFREAFDEGKYFRVGQLSPRSSKKDLNKDYTLKKVMREAKSNNIKTQ